MHDNNTTTTSVSHPRVAFPSCIFNRLKAAPGPRDGPADGSSIGKLKHNLQGVTLILKTILRIDSRLCSLKENTKRVCLRVCVC